jgi:hypothetical protein
LIEQKLADRILLRPPCNQVDDAAHCACAVQRGRDTLDHFDLAKIHRRNLQQPESANLLTGDRQAVEEHARVSAAHALDAHGRRAHRRRGCLHAHAAHLVQHHHDVAGRHQHLLFDLFAVQHLDARRLIVDAAAGAGGGDDDGFFDLDRLGRFGRVLRRRCLRAHVDRARQQAQHQDCPEDHYDWMSRWNSGSARSFSKAGSVDASNFHCFG